MKKKPELMNYTLTWSLYEAARPSAKLHLFLAPRLVNFLVAKWASRGRSTPPVLADGSVGCNSTPSKPNTSTIILAISNLVILFSPDQWYTPPTSLPALSPSWKWSAFIERKRSWRGVSLWKKLFKGLMLWKKYEESDNWNKVSCTLDRCINRYTTHILFKSDA